ncbi:MAG: hypothetical protein IT317_11815 [Anaerolineales bacterium]|nr:hypothetical protein [Anaerolineales bacterium]
MTTLDLPLVPSRARSGSQSGGPTPRPGNHPPRSDQLVTDTPTVGPDTATDLRFDVHGAGLDTDSVYNYGLDGFAPPSTDTCGASDAQDGIDLEGLAEQVYALLRREAYIERERRGARR